MTNDVAEQRHIVEEAPQVGRVAWKQADREEGVAPMIVDIVGDWRRLALRGLAAVVFGIIALVWPGLTLGVLVLLYGAYVLVDGVFLLAVAFTGAEAGDSGEDCSSWKGS